MKFKVPADWILLLVLCFCSTVCSEIVSLKAAAPGPECLRDRPERAKCLEVGAECFNVSNSTDNCYCPTDYWMFDGRCQKLDWCADGEIGDVTCKSNGTVCKTLNWTLASHKNLPFKCDCESKFVAENGTCAMSETFCREKGGKPSKYKNSVLCGCDENKFFDYNVMKCQNLDFCPFMNCYGKFEECLGSTCVCKTDYDRIGDECKPKNFCVLNDICGSAKCEGGPEDNPKSIRCYCDTGYVLARDKNGIPYCKLIRCDAHSLNPCDHICTYSADKKSYSCECHLGHTLKKDNISCEIEPSRKCTYNSCSSGSICVKVNGTNHCFCKNSLVGGTESESCTDRCGAGRSTEVCPDACKSYGDRYNCICEGKYKLSDDHVTCEERRMCLNGEEGFLNCSNENRVCIESPETPEGFKCGDCISPFQEYEGNCTDLCKVEDNKRYCEERGGACVSVHGDIGQFDCKCPPLFTWKKNVGCVFARHSYDGDLRIFNSYQANATHGEELFYYDSSLDWEKLNHDVGNSMLVLFGQALSQTNAVFCRTEMQEIGETYITCRIELQFHFKDYGFLQKLYADNLCRESVPHVPQGFCFVPPFLKLVPTKNRIPHPDVEAPFDVVNYCDSIYGRSICPASTKCVVEDIGFSCRCEKGFTVKRTTYLNNDRTGLIEICQDINECETENPCGDGAICVNTVGDYECKCRYPLVPYDITENPKNFSCARPCSLVNCGNSGSCVEVDLGFYCRCDPGFTGRYCEEKIPSYFKEKEDCSAVVVIAVGTVEGIILIAIIIYSIVFYRRFPGCNRNDTERQPARDVARADNAPNLTIDHIHMANRNMPQVNGGFQRDEVVDEPIYADCGNVR